MSKKKSEISSEQVEAAMANYLAKGGKIKVLKPMADVENKSVYQDNSLLRMVNEGDDNGAELFGETI